MAHFAGLAATGVYPSPVPFADVVTTTTHKTLRGPRGGMILCKAEHQKAVDKSVFPGAQGGPLEHVIAAKAVAFREALRPDFRDYSRRTVDNARALAAAFVGAGYDVVSGGTDNHLMLLDLRNKGLTGKVAEKALDRAGITVNKNTVPRETQSPFVTSGIRLGTPALTTRGMGEAEMAQVAALIDRVIAAPEDEHCSPPCAPTCARSPRASPSTRRPRRGGERRGHRRGGRGVALPMRGAPRPRPDAGRPLRGAGRAHTFGSGRAARATAAGHCGPSTRALAREGAATLSELAFRDGIMDQIRLREPRFHERGYLFVLAALEYMQTRRAERRHVSGAELARAVRDLAIERFGVLAREVLDHWGVRSTDDVGDIVFAMVDLGLLAAQPQDTRADFANVFDFDAAFERDYPWDVAALR
jgi:uncharacterized repeat protein (TIGR04138 family)